MKTRTLIAGTIALSLLATVSLRAADAKTTLGAKSGSKMRMEGTSNIHDWQVENTIIGGSLEVGPNFPTEPGQTVALGKVEATGSAFISVRSLMSIEKDGKPFSDAMDGIMWEHLREPQNKQIVYRLSELTLKETAKAKDAPYIFEAKGDLAVAGVTNKITMTVNVLPLGEKKVQITGTTTVKMTDFKVEPPAPKIGLGLIKTGDEVKLVFKWMVGPKKFAATGAK
jgi:hypothetical protein